MSRLYYSPAARFKSTSIAMAPQGASPARKADEEFTAKIASLVPSEVIAAFMAILVVARADPDFGAWVIRACFLICLAVTPLYLRHMSRSDPPGSPKRNHLIVSSLAFAVWGYALGGTDLSGTMYIASVAGVLPIIFTLVSGLVPLDK